MAIGDAYATAATYRAIVGKTDTSQDATTIADDLLATSRYLERRLGRFFNQDATVQVRKYYPGVSYQRTLFVNDISTTTGLVVKVDDNRDGTAETTLTITTDFELAPINAALEPEANPYTQIVLPPRVTSRAYWIELVEVTAKFGWPAIPKAIERATCHITAILRIESPRATNRIAEGFDAVIGTSTAAQRIVDELAERYAKPAWIYS